MLVGAVRPAAHRTESVEGGDTDGGREVPVAATAHGDTVCLGQACFLADLACDGQEGRGG